MRISQAEYFAEFDKLRAEFYRHLNSHTKWTNRSDINLLFSAVAKQDPLLAASLLPKLFDDYPDNPVFTEVVCGLITRSAIDDGVLRAMASDSHYVYTLPTFLLVATINAWRGEDWEEKEKALVGFVHSTTGLTIKWESGSATYLPELVHALMGETWGSLYADCVESTQEVYSLVWIARPPLPATRQKVEAANLPNDLTFS